MIKITFVAKQSYSGYAVYSINNRTKNYWEKNKIFQQYLNFEIQTR